MRAAAIEVEAETLDDAVLLEMHRDGLDTISAFRGWRIARSWPNGLHDEQVL
jgi:hypothetical protein